MLYIGRPTAISFAIAPLPSQNGKTDAGGTRTLPWKHTPNATGRALSYLQTCKSHERRRRHRVTHTPPPLPPNFSTPCSVPPRRCAFPASLPPPSPPRHPLRLHPFRLPCTAPNQYRLAGTVTGRRPHT